MDFGKLLDDWEGRETKHQKRNRKQLEQWYDKYAHDADGKVDPIRESESRDERRRRLKRMDPQRVLDLHGERAIDAARLVGQFIDRAARDGIEKVLIVHGKGKHSGTTGGVLKNTVYEELRSHPSAGEIGVPDRRLGGSGAVWVVVRYRSR